MLRSTAADRTVVDTCFITAACCAVRVERDLVNARLAESTHDHEQNAATTRRCARPGERMADLPRLRTSSRIFPRPPHAERAGLHRRGVFQYGMATNAYKLGLHPAMPAYIPKVVSLHLHEVSVSPLTIQTRLWRTRSILTAWPAQATCSSTGISCAAAAILANRLSGQNARAACHQRPALVLIRPSKR